MVLEGGPIGAPCLAAVQQLRALRSLRLKQLEAAAAPGARRASGGGGPPAAAAAGHAGPHVGMDDAHGAAPRRSWRSACSA
jgi:hypothetical protein